MRKAAIARLLPGVYQRTVPSSGVLSGLLDAMEVMHAPTEETLAAVDDLFSPYRAPDRMVAYLLGWVAFDHVLPAGHQPSVPVGRLRDLLSIAAAIARHRGTATGLRAVISAVTGVAVRVTEPADRPFHVVVQVPPAAADQLALIRRLVEAEKPAAVTADVIVVDAPPTQPPGGPS
jgi:phage tail-like protein